MRPRPAGLMLSKASSLKKDLRMPVVRLHRYAKFDQNIPSGSRVMDIFIYW